MKIEIKSINTNKVFTFNNKEELKNFTCKFIEEKGIIDNSLESKVLNNKKATVYDMLQVLSGSYKRVNLEEYKEMPDIKEFLESIGVKTKNKKSEIVFL